MPWPKSCAHVRDTAAFANRSDVTIARAAVSRSDSPPIGGSGRPRKRGWHDDLVAGPRSLEAGGAARLGQDAVTPVLLEPRLREVRDQPVEVVLLVARVGGMVVALRARQLHAQEDARRRGRQRLGPAGAQVRRNEHARAARAEVSRKRQHLGDHPVIADVVAERGDEVAARLELLLDPGLAKRAGDVEVERHVRPPLGVVGAGEQTVDCLGAPGRARVRREGVDLRERRHPAHQVQRHPPQPCRCRWPSARARRPPRARSLPSSDQGPPAPAGRGPTAAVLALGSRLRR